MTLPGITLGEGSIVAAGAIVMYYILPSLCFKGFPGRNVKYCKDRIKNLEILPNSLK